jgi:hypothetical protein
MAVDWHNGTIRSNRWRACRSRSVLPEQPPSRQHVMTQPRCEVFDSLVTRPTGFRTGSRTAVVVSAD